MAASLGWLCNPLRRRMNVRVSQDEHQEGKRAEVSSDSSIKTTSTLLNAEHQSANCTAIAKAEPSTSKISEVNNATLSPEDAATVRAYVDRFDCMGPFTAGPAPLIQIRALMLGQCGSGMSCLAARFVNDAWFDNYDPTQYYGYGFDLRKRLFDKHLHVEMLQEWPTIQSSPHAFPGHLAQHYRSVRHCEALFLVYDVTSRASFEAAQEYHQTFLRERAARCKCPEHETGASCPLRPLFRGLSFVLANKVDCEKCKWEIPLEEGQEFASSISPLAHFIPVSAKTGEGCRTADVEELIKRILLRRTQEPQHFIEERRKRLRVFDNPATMKKLEAYHDSQLYYY